MLCVHARGVEETWRGESGEWVGTIHRFFSIESFPFLKHGPWCSAGQPLQMVWVSGHLVCDENKRPDRQSELLLSEDDSGSELPLEVVTVHTISVTGPCDSILSFSCHPSFFGGKNEIFPGW